MAVSREYDSRRRRSALALLRRKIGLAASIHLGICVVWAIASSPRMLTLWLLGATSLSTYGLGFLVWHAAENAPDSTAGPLPRLGPGTIVTLLRMSCLSLLAGYVLSPPERTELWLVAGLYAAIGGGDWLDGFLARRTGYETRLGERLDMQVDVLGMLVVPLIAVTVGRLPPWYLVLSAAPFVFHADLARRRAGGQPCHRERLRQSAHTRAFAGFQMALITVAFVPRLDASVVWVVATVFMTPSLVAFMRDWCVGTGRLVPDAPSYDRLLARTMFSARVVAPALLRTTFAVGAFWMAPAQELFGPLWSICALATILGFAPRIFVFVWLVLVGLGPIGTPQEIALAAAASSVLMLGGGYGSLYQPEERWFFGRHGGQPDVLPVAVQTTNRY